MSNLDYNVYLSGTVAKCHLHKNLYQNPLPQALSPEYAVSGDYGASAAGGSANGLSSRLTVARMYCLNDQTSHVKSNPSLTGVKIFYPYETEILLKFTYMAYMQSCSSQELKSSIPMRLTSPYRAYVKS